MTPASARQPDFEGAAPLRPNPVGNVLAIASVVVLELCRRKDVYVLFILTAVITAIMGSVSFFEMENVSRYLREICLFLIWISSLVIAVVTTARQIPAEREQRTLFPLLAKPVTRHEVVIGKFAGCWLATGLALVMFQALLLHWFMLGIICALSLLGSVVLAAPSSTNTIVLIVAAGLLLVGRHLNKVALGLEEPGQSIVYALYYLLPHLEFFDLRDLIIHGWGLVRWPVVGGAVVYALAYITLFLSLACLAFRRKAVN
jgi:ABC-type Na+ efflux pump permease subunit